jgi:hypothetical protein
MVLFSARAKMALGGFRWKLATQGDVFMRTAFLNPAPRDKERRRGE